MRRVQSSVVGRQSSASVVITVVALVVNQLLHSSPFAFFRSLPGRKKTLVLRGETLLTVSHGTIENGVLVMSGGKIAAIGAAGAVKIPKDADGSM